MGSSKNIQTWAPLPERERSTTIDNPLTSIAHGLHVLMPILLVQIDCQEPTALICEQRINAGDESIPMRIFSRKVPSDDIVSDRQKSLMQALTAFDPRFLADAANPLVTTGGLVASPSGFPTFKPARINILAASKKGSEQFDLGLSRIVLCNNRSRRSSGRVMILGRKINLRRRIRGHHWKLARRILLVEEVCLL